MPATIRDHLRAIIDTTTGFPRARAEAALDLLRCPKCGKQGSICSASTRDECVNWRESNRA